MTSKCLFIVIDIRISANCGVPKAFQRNQVPNITVVEVRIAKKALTIFKVAKKSSYKVFFAVGTYLLTKHNNTSTFSLHK